MRLVLITGCAQTALSELGERTCSGGRGPWTGRRGAEGGKEMGGGGGSGVIRKRDTTIKFKSL